MNAKSLQSYSGLGSTLGVGKSEEYFQRAKAIIPGASQTFSKGYTQFVHGVAPLFLERGLGSHVWDVDGNEYIDYAMALGPVILGHNYAAVTDAVVQQIQKGTTYSLPHPLEIEVAEELLRCIPNSEMFRFGKNGSDATSGAVRLARAATGRDVVACCGYHGWQDWYIGTTTRNAGVPKSVRELTKTFSYNDISSLERIFDEHKEQVAAVVLEPIGVEEPKEDFLAQVRELSTKHGAVLIFDEVITGFRLGLGGAQAHFNVTPDLTCLGKAMGNGFPISAVSGRRELMQLFEKVFFSFTFGGETASLAAAKATIHEMRTKPVFEHIWKLGAELRDGYNSISRDFGMIRYTECIGLAPRSAVMFRDVDGFDSYQLKSLFQQEAIKRGVLFTGGHMVCFSHTPQDIEITLAVYRDAMKCLAEGISRGSIEAMLQGPPVQPVFRRA